jgi:hypothetical protein
MPSRYSHSHDHCHYHYSRHRTPSPHSRALRMSSPRPPPFRPGRRPRELSWHSHSNSYYESHGPSVNPSILQHPFPSMLPNLHQPSFTTRDLPSRTAALNRRAAVVSTALTHLTTVIRPLETVQVRDLTHPQLHDMYRERMELVQAIREFEEQAEEVLEILAQVLTRRGVGPTRGWNREGVEEWGVEGWERGRGERTV